MKTNVKLISGILAMALLIAACGTSSNKQADEHGGHEEEGHEEEEGTVSLTEQQMDAIGLKMVQLEKRTLNIAVSASGVLEVAPQDKADANALSR